jgi:hypothetical protein
VPGWEQHLTDPSGSRFATAGSSSFNTWTCSGSLAQLSCSPREIASPPGSVDCRSTHLRPWFPPPFPSPNRACSLSEPPLLINPLHHLFPLSSNTNRLPPCTDEKCWITLRSFTVVLYVRSTEGSAPRSLARAMLEGPHPCPTSVPLWAFSS